jgi:hypothetical protein
MGEVGDAAEQGDEPEHGENPPAPAGSNGIDERRWRRHSRSHRHTRGGAGKINVDRNALPAAPRLWTGRRVVVDNLSGHPVRLWMTAANPPIR